MEQLRAEKERLLYDVQRRGRPLDDDDERSAIRRGLLAGPSQPCPPTSDTDPSEAGGPTPSDSPPTLPPGPPSSASNGSVASYGQKQLAAEALADLAVNAAGAALQSVRTVQAQLLVASQPGTHMPVQHAMPALCFSNPQGLDSTAVATAANAQQMNTNGASAKANHWHHAAQPLSMNVRINVAAPPSHGPSALKQKFDALVMCDFTPRHPNDLPTSQWVSYASLLQLFQPHAPMDVWRTGPGNLKQLITEWYKGDPTFIGLAPDAWCKRVASNEPQDQHAGSGKKHVLYKFCFEYTPRHFPGL